MCLPFLRVINEASQCNLHLFTRTIFMRGAQACCGRLGVEGKQQHSSTMQSAHSLWDEKWLSEDTLLFVGSRKLAIASSIGSTATVSAEERGQVTSSNAMPSIEEMCLLSAAAPTTTTTTAPQDFLARDMEELVSEIKENLRLSSGGLKSRPTFSVLHKSSRPSPYRIPSRSRSWGDPSCDACLKAGSSCSGHSYKKATKAAAESDDPYEMLQELLRDGGLIKEAVRRLNMGLSPKQRYFYDSDEDTRSPLRVCHVEL